ncbi:MAG: 4'-phosphopantetheinyl transferase superfamily protein [Oscillospiraceae bacterium]|nr:4'-phosphopantetheinyl transferase superfamily protein [Oscillospiraceae bacterium]
MKLYICENYKNAGWTKKVPDGEKISLTFARLCICDYIGRRPERVEFKFKKNKYGKPFVEKISRKKGGKINRDVFFSLSHSGDILICAVADYNIGADCQAVNTDDITSCKKIAGRFFSDDENLFLNKLPETEYTDRFFKIWTKKEAYVKYTGRGLSEGLNSFSVFEAAGVYFMRAAPKTAGAYIYICAGEENFGGNLRVKYTN